MRQFGELKGQDLIQLLNTLATEGALTAPGVIHKLQATHPMGAQNSLFIRENVFIHAASTDYKFSLSSALGKRGFIDKNQLQEMKDIRKAEQPTPSLARLLLRHKLIDEANLKAVINHLDEVLAYEIMMWKTCDFKLIPVEHNPEDFSTYFAGELEAERLLDVTEFAADADKNLPVLMLMREKLSNPNMILKRLREADPAELSDPQNHVYQAVNNRNSLRDILLLSDLGYFETYTALFQLLSWETIGMGSLETPRYAKKAPEPMVSRPAATPRPTPAATATRSEAPVVPSSASDERSFLRRARGADLFQVLSALIKGGKRSGKLRVENQKSVIHSDLMLHEGNLVHASSTMYSQRFGDLLVHKGLITVEDLQDALETQKEQKGKHLGEILVAEKLIQAEIIPQLVYHQIECVLYELLSWADAKFFFEESATPLQQEFVVFADYEIVDGRLIQREGSSEPKGRDVLGDADKNLAILLMIKEKMPNPSAVVKRTEQEPVSELSEEQKQVIALVNGQHSINDLLVLSDLDYFATYTALFQIFSSGLIEIQKEAPASALAAPASTPLSRPKPPMTPSVASSVSSSPMPSPVARPEPLKSPVGAASTAVGGSDATQYEQLRKLLGEDLLRALMQFPARQAPALRKGLEALVEMGLSAR
ncbi:MAG: DUF4388 domain-containing protein [Candidatus Sericytochromatia bacterium]|nr:DUF4388 domain-containing protein [Candidatus Sericytochromatia bacterium]